MNFAKLIRAILDQPEPDDLPTLTTAGAISHDDIYKILVDLFHDASIYLSDLVFKTATIDELQKILAYSKTKNGKYIAEYFDCDDFSYQLQGIVSIYPWSSLPFGIIWTNQHAFNIYIDNESKVYFIEPQTCQIYTELMPWAGDTVQLIVM